MRAFTIALALCSLMLGSGVAQQPPAPQPQTPSQPRPRAPRTPRDTQPIPQGTAVLAP